MSCSFTPFFSVPGYLNAVILLQYIFPYPPPDESSLSPLWCVTTRKLARNRHKLLRVWLCLLSVLCPFEFSQTLLQLCFLNLSSITASFQFLQCKFYGKHLICVCKASIRPARSYVKFGSFSRGTRVFKVKEYWFPGCCYLFQWLLDLGIWDCCLGELLPWL